MAEIFVPSGPASTSAVYAPSLTTSRVVATTLVVSTSLTFAPVVNQSGTVHPPLITNSSQVNIQTITDPPVLNVPPTQATSTVYVPGIGLGITPPLYVSTSSLVYAPLVDVTQPELSFFMVRNVSSVFMEDVIIIDTPRVNNSSSVFNNVVDSSIELHPPHIENESLIYEPGFSINLFVSPTLNTSDVCRPMIDWGFRSSPVFTYNDVILQVRRSMGLVQFSTEDLEGDADSIDSVSGAFSKKNIRRRIHEAVRDVVSKTKAVHSSHLIDEITVDNHRSPDILKGVKYVRILKDRIFRNGVRCSEREGNVRFNIRKATEEFPIVIFYDGTARVYPSGGTVNYFYINPPVVSDVDEDAVNLRKRMFGAVVASVVSSLYKTLGDPQMADYWNNEYELELSPYKLRTVTTQLDREVEVE
jgi:hypothetical protein